jgi:TolB protein
VSATSHTTQPIRTRRPSARLPRGFSLVGTALLALAACDRTTSPIAPSEDLGPEPVSSPVTESGVTGGPFAGKIAFSAFDGAQRDIYVMNADGSALTRLTSFAGNEVTPAWSWDNSKIAFVRDRTDAGPAHRDVFIVDANGANGHWASPTNTVPLAEPAWSPDGSRLVVRTNKFQVMFLDLATGALTPFKNGQEDVFATFPSFDPTGQKLVTGGSSIHVYKADGSTTLLAMATPHNETAEGPTFSPDGTKILLTELVSLDRGRKLYQLTGFTFTLLSSSGVGARASWAPDGKNIAFSSLRGKVYRANADATHRVRLAGTGGFDTDVAYSH